MTAHQIARIARLHLASPEIRILRAEFPDLDADAIVGDGDAWQGSVLSGAEWDENRAQLVDAVRVILLDERADAIADDLRAGRNLDRWLGSGLMPAPDEINGYAEWAARNL